MLNNQRKEDTPFGKIFAQRLMIIGLLGAIIFGGIVWAQTDSLLARGVAGIFGGVLGILIYLLFCFATSD